MRHLERSGLLPAASAASVWIAQFVRGAADRDHADAVLARLRRSDRRARGGDRHLHHRLRVGLELDLRVLQREPIGLARDDFALQQLGDGFERLGHAAALVGGLQPDHVGIIDQRTRADAEHGAASGHVVELHHARGQRERMMVGQRDDTGAEADVTGALRGRGDEHLGAGNDLEPAGVVLADPGLVIVETVEVLEQLHVAIHRQRRVLIERVERGEEDAGAQVAVVHLDWPPG